MVARGITWKRILLLSLSGLLLTARPAYAADYVASLPKEPSEPPAESNNYNCSIVSELKLTKGDTATLNGGASEIASVTPTDPQEVAVGVPYQLSNGNWSFDAKPGPNILSSADTVSNAVIIVNYKNGKKRALIINPLGKVNLEAKGSGLTISFEKQPIRGVTLKDWLPAATPAPQSPKDKQGDDDKGGGY